MGETPPAEEEEETSVQGPPKRPMIIATGEDEEPLLPTPIAEKPPKMEDSPQDPHDGHNVRKDQPQNPMKDLMLEQDAIRQAEQRSLQEMHQQSFFLNNSDLLHNTETGIPETDSPDPDAEAYTITR